MALENHHGPIAFALTRQNVPIFEASDASAVEKGAYVLKDFGKKKPELILMASGSRVVSFPSWELFEKQDAAYRESVLPKKIQARIAVEAGASLGWERYVGSSGKIIAIDRFGASAPYKIIFEKLGFTIANILAQAKPLLPKKDSSKKVKTKKTIRKKK